MGTRVQRGSDATAAIDRAVDILGRPALWMLALMLLVDGAFVQLHRLHLQGVLDDRFSLEVERSLPEYYQHAKELLAAALAGTLFLTRGDRLYLCWAALLAYLFLDDAFEVHERLGSIIASGWHDTRAVGLGAEHLGELLISGAAGLIFLIAFVASWSRGTPGGRQLSLWLLAALAMLAVFGVVVDTLHALVTAGPWQYRLGILEDGGELAVMTVMFWLVFTDVSGGAARHW